MADTRLRRFFGSSDLQMSQSHPITGTPVDVPVPRNVTRIGPVDFSVVNRHPVPV